MKRIISLFALLGGIVANAQTSFNVTVSNSIKSDRTDQPVVIALQKYGEVQSALVKQADGSEVPCQLDDLDQDERFDELCFLVNLKGKESKTYTITLYKEGSPRTYEPRVYTEMLMRNDKVKEKNKQKAS